MRTVHLSRWHEFVEHTDQLEGWAFRGQHSPHWPLVSSLTRRLREFCPDQRLWPLREARAMRVFRRKAHIHLHDRTALDDELRCLALMQHHGSPTRLLDFTKSPFVAAFFALESATEDVVVYALNTPALWNLRPRFDPSLDRDRIDPRLPGNFERYFASNQLPVLWFGEPTEMDGRLMAQSGLFVVPGTLELSLDAILEAYGDSDELLQRFVLAGGMRAEAMRALYRMNITYATLFPDLVGLAQSLRYELEAIWPRLIEEYEQHTVPGERA
ncbi:FRG domain-containing protein [Ramlibacter sp. AW1]|uniref:FRG domain-containing protein n=1 Tax=Ramlibacter aurantiacus TaxID=2801330 RepID=A0A937D5T6_9BURK|nr:FRG domain-containing protein [Ramlibacter aurantiacus]MBL0421642.1 FRG domain-containing protein [Ramlibacter aurantiacus]